jgi:hypothetical protein
MTHTNEVLANEAAMRNPVEALKVLRVTTQSCRHTTTETFLQAYIQEYYPACLHRGKLCYAKQ